MEQEKQQAKITYIDETSYEDNTYWIYYETEETLGYEIVDEETANSYKVGDTITVKCKPNVKVCSPKLEELISECYASENEMWYVDYGEMDEDEVLKIQKEIENLDKQYNSLNLSDYITFKNAGFLIIVYGGVCTLFEF